MADYINLEDAVDEFQEWLSGAPYWNVSGDDAEKILRGIPAADVRPVVHARWIDKGLHQTCSACGFIHYTDCAYKFCPNCGAMMDEEG